MSNLSRNPRRAFTLVELLVLIGIICFLLALLLPALQCGRGGCSRRSSCQNNLKQYGLALHNYNDAFGRLPSAYSSVVIGGASQSNWGSVAPMNRVGWQVLILPFIEQSIIHDQLNWSLTDKSQRVYNDSGNGLSGTAVNSVLNDGLPARQHNFPAAKCPNDPFPSINSNGLGSAAALGRTNLANFAGSSYELSMGAQQLQSTDGCNLGAMGSAADKYQANSLQYNQYAQGGASFPRVDAGQAGAPFTNALNGILPPDTESSDAAIQPRIGQLSGAYSANGYGCRFQEVTDGLSNTIFVGEILPECTGSLQAGWWPLTATRPTDVLPGGSVTYAGGSPGASTIIPINTFVTCPQIKTGQKGTSPFGGPQSACVNNINGAAAFGFRSRHPGVCQFVFGDGSVRALSESMDHGVYQLLGAKSDSVAIPAYE